MVIKDEMIWTHPDNNLVHKNITRRLIKERLAPDIDMQVIEKAFVWSCPESRRSIFMRPSMRDYAGY